MRHIQEPKYIAIDGRIVNRASGEAIPDNEPVFILRAKDKNAVVTLIAYLLCEGDHLDAVQKRIGHFRQFAADHPERMKQPDTAR